MIVTGPAGPARGAGGAPRGREGGAVAPAATSRDSAWTSPFFTTVTPEACRNVPVSFTLAAPERSGICFGMVTPHRRPDEGHCHETDPHSRRTPPFPAASARPLRGPAAPRRRRDALPTPVLGRGSPCERDDLPAVLHRGRGRRPHQHPGHVCAGPSARGHAGGPVVNMLVGYGSIAVFFVLVVVVLERSRRATATSATTWSPDAPSVPCTRRC